MAKSLQDIKKSVVFIGRGETFYATGCLVKSENAFYIVTAKHVVFDQNKKLIDQGAYAEFNGKNGEKIRNSFEEIKNNFNLSWTIHTNPSIDLAVLPIPTNVGTTNENVEGIQEELFLKEDLVELTNVYFLSFQPGVHTVNDINPIIRFGAVSRINNNNTFFIDGSAFPGNSGSPVFIKSSPARYNNDGGIDVGFDSTEGKFIGVVGGYIHWSDVAISQYTGRPRITFEENTGLSIVNSVTSLKEILNYPQAKAQAEQLKKAL